MKALTILASLALCSLVSGCSKFKRCAEPPISNCQDIVTIDKSQYDNTVTTNYGISSAVISGDCLEIRFGASGCSGSTWIVDLIGTTEVGLSLPPFRSVRMKLTNTELCTAVPSKTISFDLRPLRLEGTKAIILKLDGYSGDLTYRY